MALVVAVLSLPQLHRALLGLSAVTPHRHHGREGGQEQCTGSERRESNDSKL
jgi:hypothetical protein